MSGSGMAPRRPAPDGEDKDGAHGVEHWAEALAHACGCRDARCVAMALMRWPAEQFLETLKERARIVHEEGDRVEQALEAAMVPPPGRARRCPCVRGQGTHGGEMTGEA